MRLGFRVAVVCYLLDLFSFPQESYGLGVMDPISQPGRLRLGESQGLACGAHWGGGRVTIQTENSDPKTLMLRPASW